MTPYTTSEMIADVGAQTCCALKRIPTAMRAQQICAPAGIPSGLKALRLFSLRLAWALVFTAFSATLAHAQTVHWESDPGNPSALRLVFTDCSPDGDPELPTLPGATLTYVGSEQNTSIVNFQVTRTATLTYLVRSRQSGPVQIPSFQIKTTRGDLRVAAFDAATPAASLESVAAARLIPERNSVWAGEVFGITYELSASRRNNPQVNQTFEWNPAPLVAEDWSKPEVTETVVNGERRLQVAYRTRAVGTQPNTIRLEAASHLMNIQTGTVGLGFLQQPRMEPVSVTSDQPVIEVRPLPPSPAGFTGAVGQFTLESKVVPAQAAVGEPVTWTLELQGTGNWPDIAGLPSRDVSNDFQVVQPKARRTPAEGKLFDVSLHEDVVLVPTKPGTYTLSPISFTYFDPKSGRYQTLTTPRTALTITPPAAPRFNVTPQPDAGTRVPDAAPALSDIPAAAARAPTPSPAPPSGIPRDPLPGEAEVRSPLLAGSFMIGLAAPFAGLVLLWLGLALRAALRTDPLRPRREARARLVGTLAAIQQAAPADRRALLLAWQRESAVLWQIHRAAPPASAIEDSEWQRLWTEADRTLYGENHALPADWVARAQEAAVSLRLPPFKPWRLFLPQNLMPFAALVTCAWIVSLITTAIAAEPSVGGDAISSYLKGDFAAAEKAWRTRIAEVPTDWIARHNLALALAQQERPGEAAAHAASAFAQRPDHPSVQWHLRLATDRAGFVPAPLSPFLRESARGSFTRLANPAQWQVIAMAAAALAAAALGWMLVNAHGPRKRAYFRIAGILFVIALAISSIGIAAWRNYGIAADTRAVTVARSGTLRSIPTEAETSQKTTALAAGSMAIAGDTFLGWTHLTFENGQTGWVRRDEFVPIWR